MMNKLPVFVMNLEHREDRLLKIIKVLAPIHEFDIHPFIVKGDKQDKFFDHFRQFQRMCRFADYQDLPYFIYCEDDTIFTPGFNLEQLVEDIKFCQQEKYDLLFTGLTAVEEPRRIADSIIKVQNCLAIQFTVIFQQLYEKVLDWDFDYIKSWCRPELDYILSLNHTKKACTLPFMTMQNPKLSSDYRECSQEEVAYGFKHTEELIFEELHLN